MEKILKVGEHFRLDKKRHKKSTGKRSRMAVLYTYISICRGRKTKSHLYSRNSITRKYARAVFYQEI